MSQKEARPARSQSTDCLEDFRRVDRARDTYVIALNASKMRRQLSSFESRVQRGAPSHAEAEAALRPGPGDYSLPSAFEGGGGRGGSSFLSSMPRFSMPREGGGNGPATEYTSAPSDFDANREAIRRRTRLQRRASWTAAVSFSSAAARFPEPLTQREPSPATSESPAPPAPSQRAAQRGVYFSSRSEVG